MASLPSDDDENSISRQVAMDMACGFCEGIESVCVCRIVRETERNSRNNSNNHSDNDHMDDMSSQFAPGQVMGIVNPVTKQLSPTYHAEIAAAVKSTSILDNLPPVEAAVPLRRRQRQNNGTGNGQGNAVFGVKKAPIFAVSPAVMQDGQGSPLYIPPAECSGDPRNCPACKDDDFGREFCESLSKSMCNNGPGHRCENCPSEQAAKAEALAQTSVPLAINRTRSSVTSASSAAGPARSQSQSGSDKISSSPTDIEAEYLDIKCCGNSKLCGTLDKNCGDDETQPGHAHTHAYDGVQGEGGAGSAMPTGTWEEKISQLAPHGHEVDVTLSADEAWRTLKAHPNAKFASLAMLADVVARGTKCLGQPAPPTPSPRAEKPDPFATASIPKPRPIEQTVSTGSKRRRFEVHEYAVKQALAVLDAHPNHPLKKRRLSDLRGT